MALFDDLDKEMKKVETQIHKAELDKQVKDLEQEINRAGHELSAEIRKVQDSVSHGSDAP